MLGLPPGGVGEGVGVEAARQVAVEPYQQVAGKGRRHAGGIVVGGLQPCHGFGLVDADQQPGARAQQLAQLLQQRLRFLGAEVAD